MIVLIRLYTAAGGLFLASAQRIREETKGEARVGPHLCQTLYCHYILCPARLIQNVVRHPLWEIQRSFSQQEQRPQYTMHTGLKQRRNHSSCDYRPGGH